VILAVAVFNTFVNYILEEHTISEWLRSPEVGSCPSPRRPPESLFERCADLTVSANPFLSGP